MRLIDADAFDQVLIDGELTARREKKYVFVSAINTIRGNLKMMPTIEPEHTLIPVTKEQMLQAGYEGREVRFYIGGRLFAIRELAQ